jgi:hypothetical protein
MNNFTNSILNKIKQPAQCCTYCGKSYKKKSNLDKHFVVCELLQVGKKRNSNIERNQDEDEAIPSQQKMFQMLVELGQKYNKLEEKVEEMNKWIVKKKKKINGLEWLNTNIKPTINFDSIIDTIIINEDDIKFLFHNSFNDLLNEVFSRTIYSEDFPIFAFVQKPNLFYIYHSETGWIELSRERLIKFLDKVHMKIFKEFYEWKQAKKSIIQCDTYLANNCDKTLIKISGLDFKQEQILSKIRNMMYSKMKTDLKALVEYEFEF